MDEEGPVMDAIKVVKLIANITKGVEKMRMSRVEFGEGKYVNGDGTSKPIFKRRDNTPRSSNAMDASRNIMSIDSTTQKNTFNIHVLTYVDFETISEP